MRLDITNSGHIDGNSTSTQKLAFNATFGACSLIDDMVSSLSLGNDVEAAFASRFLQELDSWSKNLPEELREFKQASAVLIANDQELAVGCIHVACVYYFAVILITRPFMISHLMERLPGKARLDPTPVSHFEEDSEAFQLAQVCIDSAIYMAQVCHEVLVSGLLLNNMCMLK